MRRVFHLMRKELIELGQDPRLFGIVILAPIIQLNVLGYAAFALSFVLSVIYLIQNRLLRHHRLRTLVWRFPALEMLERMSRSSVAVGRPGCLGSTTSQRAGLLFLFFFFF